MINVIAILLLNPSEILDSLYVDKDIDDNNITEFATNLSASFFRLVGIVSELFALLNSVVDVIIRVGGVNYKSDKMNGEFCKRKKKKRKMQNSGYISQAPKNE